MSGKIMFISFFAYHHPANISFIKNFEKNTEYFKMLQKLYFNQKVQYGGKLMNGAI